MCERYFRNEGFRKTFIIVISAFTMNQALNKGKEEKEMKRKAFMYHPFIKVQG